MDDIQTMYFLRSKLYETVFYSYSQQFIMATKQIKLRVENISKVNIIEMTRICGI